MGQVPEGWEHVKADPTFHAHLTNQHKVTVSHYKQQNTKPELCTLL